MKKVETSKIESRKKHKPVPVFFSAFDFRLSTFLRRGLSYVEILMSLVIIATAVAASLRAFGGYSVGRRAFEERAIAIELANQLMAEINRLPFSEPSGGGSTIGIDSGELATDRSTFDDIDDYNGWDASPPRDRTNAQMSQYTNYEQQVTVAYDATIPAPTTGNWAANSFKKITVKVLRNGKTLATLDTVRSNNNAAN